MHDPAPSFIGHRLFDSGFAPAALSLRLNKIPCGSCSKSYIGETGRGLQTRLKEHKRYMRNNSEHSALVIHAEKTHHIPDWGGAVLSVLQQPWKLP